MHYFGLMAIIHVVAENRNCEIYESRRMVENGVTKFRTFNCDDFVELFVVKPLIFTIYQL